MTTMCIEPKGSAAVPGCDEYERFLEAILEQFARTSGGPLFTTNATGLWKVFLDDLPVSVRQHYRCHACRRFVEAFGGLVMVADSTGRSLEPAVWPHQSRLPNLFRDAVANVRRAVMATQVEGVFYGSGSVLGQPATHRNGEWHHMAVECPKHLVWKNNLSTAGQMMAAKRQDYEMLQRALAEYQVETVERALAVLRADALYRGEHVLGVAEWLQGLQATLGGVKGRTRENLVWRAVAGAPTGFCHIKSSMIGTLLDDLQAGLGLDVVSARFREKMNPLQYQRPSAAPRAGNIAQAEKVVAQLAAEGSLDRRYATLEDLETIWRPRADKPRGECAGVFGAVRARGSCRCWQSAVEIPTKEITWVRFRDQVLPTAERIEYLVSGGRAGYLAFVTAVNPAAPPILQWDSPEHRNPVSWYVYHHGSTALAWNLAERQWVEVEAVALQPSMWHGTFPHQGESAVAVLRGCQDMARGDSLALFPEILRADFHAVRATIEAYSRTRRLGAVERPACGIRIDKQGCPGEFRVTAGGVVAEYKIDRWE